MELLGPVTGAFIGYCANRIAVKMIFWPHREVRVFGVRVPFTPGMFVKRRRVFARAFAEAIVAEFCSPQDVIRVLGQALDAGLEDRVRARLSPMAVAAIDAKIASMSAADVKAAAAEVSAFIRESSMIATLVTDNVEAMSPAEIEKIVFEICGRELRSMAWFDAGVGALVGGIQALVAMALSS